MRVRMKFDEEPMIQVNTLRHCDVAGGCKQSKARPEVVLGVALLGPAEVKGEQCDVSGGCKQSKTRPEAVLGEALLGQTEESPEHYDVTCGSE